MLKNSLAPQTGRILLAEPFLSDIHFKRSVVLLIDHSEEGSYGLTLNKPSEFRLSDITAEFPNFNPPIYIGGPLKTDKIFVIHHLGNRVKGSIPIVDNFYWGGDMETIRELIANNEISENDIRFFLGISGWSKNQLEKELDEDSWLIVNYDSDKVNHSKPEKLWTNFLREMDNEYKLWIYAPPHPSYN